MSRAGILLLALACASTGVPLNAPFTAPYGKTIRVEGTDLTVMLADVEDSRCPRNATCVWEGEVHVTLQVNAETVRVKVPGTVSVPGYSIEVREVSPYPDDPPPPKSEYRATVIVSPRPA